MFAAGRDVVRTSAAPYAVTLIGSYLAATVVGVFVSPAEGDLALQYVLLLVGVVASGALWWLYRPSGRLSRVQAVGLMLMAILWLAVHVRMIAYAEAFGPVSITVVLLLAMLWIKPPDARGARETVDGLSWLLVGAAGTALAVEVGGWAPSWYVRLQLDSALPGFDRDYYWLPLADLLGLDGRWAGPFVHPNHAAIVGGLLIVVGLCRDRWSRGVFTGAGLLVLLLVQSRTGTVATAAAVACVGIVLWRTGGLDRSRALVGAATGGVLVSLLVVPLVRGMQAAGDGGYLASYATAMGRSEVWRAYLALWRESPFVGISDARIVVAAREGLIPGWAATAHNLIIDTMTRLGVVGALILILLLIAAAMGATVAARRGAAVAIGLVALLVVSGLTESLVSWDRFSTGMVVLLAAWVAGFEQRSPGRPTPLPQPPSAPSAPLPTVQGRGSDPAPDRGPSPAAD